jgi:hypothetical protein
VWFKIIGTDGVWEKTEFKNKNKNREVNFAADSLVEIDIEGPVIGDLKTIKIWVFGIYLKSLC